VIPVVYHDLPDFVVNLNSGEGRRSSFMKVHVSLEIADQESLKIVQAYEPRIVDSFQTYLRELKPDDLRGSAGIFRLREELLFRINKIVHPAKVNDILFKEMIVQ
jgi:flagellar FliL protein